MGFVGQAIGSIAGGISGGAGINYNPASEHVSNEQVANTYDAAKTGLSQQQALIAALQAQNGVQNQSNVFNQQQALANQLQAQGMGQGPNPAMAQLNNRTGENIAQQASLMASQRGIGANPALLARQAAMQGANIQQQAVGQGAAMQAQQQLAAQAALGQQQASMANLAGNQVGQLQSSQNALGQQAQNLYGTMLGSEQGVDQTNAGIQSSGNQMKGGIAGGLLGGAGAALGAFAGGGAKSKAHGGLISYADGGMAGPQSFMGQYLAQRYAQGGPIVGEALANQGMRVPGKANVAGDSLKNDNVKALLSPGEIVIPRSISMGENAPDKAAQFVAAVLAKQGMKK